MRHRMTVLGNNRGVALLLAVTVISLLVAVTVQFGKEMRQELFGSANYLTSSKLGTMVKSGYEVGALLLQKDGGKNSFDSLHDDWAKLANTNLTSLYNSGKLSVLISDLGGRIPLNSLVNDKGVATGATAKRTREIFKNLLENEAFGDRNEEEVTLILDAVTDWIDKDDNESGNIEETESGYYQNLDPAYSCKNGPIEFIEELLLIRGITVDLFYGNGGVPGLKDLVTVHGTTGKININTAPPFVLRALGDEMTDELVQKLVEFRGDEENRDELEKTSWYTSLLPSDVTLKNGSLTVQSNIYTIIATAERNDMVKTLRAVVQRQSNLTIGLITRKVE